MKSEQRDLQTLKIQILNDMEMIKVIERKKFWNENPKIKMDGT